MSEVHIIYTLVSSETDAHNLAQKCIQKKMSACVNIFPCQSVYESDGTLKTTNEYALWIKTTPPLVKPLMKFLIENHPYDLPAVLHFASINSWLPFAKWVMQQVT